MSTTPLLLNRNTEGQIYATSPETPDRKQAKLIAGIVSTVGLGIITCYFFSPSSVLASPCKTNECDLSVRLSTGTVSGMLDAVSAFFTYRHWKSF